MAVNKKQRVWIIVGSVVVGIPLLIGLCVWLWFCHVRSEWTEEAPAAIEVAEVSDADRRQLLPKYRKLEQAMHRNRAAELELKSDQVNKLIAMLDELAPLRGRVSATLDGEHVIVKTSFPLNDVALFNGRHLNGEFKVKAEIVDGKMTAQIVEGRKLDGTPFPPWMLEKANEVLSNPEFRDRLERAVAGKKLGELLVSGSKLMIRTRGSK